MTCNLTSNIRHKAVVCWWIINLVCHARHTTSNPGQRLQWNQTYKWHRISVPSTNICQTSTPCVYSTAFLPCKAATRMQHFFFQHAISCHLGTQSETTKHCNQLLLHLLDSTRPWARLVKCSKKTEFEVMPTFFSLFKSTQVCDLWERCALHIQQRWLAGKICLRLTGGALYLELTWGTIPWKGNLTFTAVPVPPYIDCYCVIDTFSAGRRGIAFWDLSLFHFLGDVQEEKTTLCHNTQHMWFEPQSCNVLTESCSCMCSVHCSPRWLKIEGVCVHFWKHRSVLSILTIYSNITPGFLGYQPEIITQSHASGEQNLMIDDEQNLMISHDTLIHDLTW